jgi:transposase
MIQRFAIKTKVQLTREQSSLVNQMIGSLRSARNKLIEVSEKFYVKNGTFVGLGQVGVFKNHLIALKEKFPYISIVPSLTLQNMAINLEDDFYKYFEYLSSKVGRKIGKPRFKNKTAKQSITIPINTGSDIKYDHLRKKMTFTKFKIDNKQSWFDIDLKKLPFDCKPEEVQGLLCELTLTKSKTKADEYFASLSFKKEIEDKKDYSNTVAAKVFFDYVGGADFDSILNDLRSRALGADVGLKVFCNLSDSKKIIKPDMGFEYYEEKIARLQRKRAHMMKSKNLTKKSKVDFSEIKPSEEELEIKRLKKIEKDKEKAEKKASKAAGIEQPNKSKSKSTRFNSKEEKEKAPKKKSGENQRKDVLELFDQMVVESNARPLSENITFKNIEKIDKKINKLHQKLTNRNRDFINKTVYYLVAKRQEDIICIEDLNIAEMMQNRNLAKAIGRANWGLFFSQLDKKCIQYNKLLLKCNRFDPSSKTCNKCKCINNGLTLGDRYWICEHCGAVLDRDENAAINIVEFALVEYISKLIKSIRGSCSVKTKKVSAVVADPAGEASECPIDQLSMNGLPSAEQIGKTMEQSLSIMVKPMEAAKSLASR